MLKDLKLKKRSWAWFEAQPEKQYLKRWERLQLPLENIQEEKTEKWEKESGAGEIF